MTQEEKEDRFPSTIWYRDILIVLLVISIIIYSLKIIADSQIERIKYCRSIQNNYTSNYTELAENYTEPIE